MELRPRRKAPRLGRKVAVALRERVLEAVILLTLAEVCAGAPVYSGIGRAPVIKFPNIFLLRRGSQGSPIALQAVLQQQPQQNVGHNLMGHTGGSFKSAIAAAAQAV